MIMLVEIWYKEVLIGKIRSFGWMTKCETTRFLWGEVGSLIVVYFNRPFSGRVLGKNEKKFLHFHFYRLCDEGWDLGRGCALCVSNLGQRYQKSQI